MGQLEELRPELTGYCYRMLGSTFDADDAVQDTIVRAWQAMGEFEGRSSLRSWVYRIATNVCLDTLRGRKRRAMPMDMSGPVPSTTPPTETLPHEVFVEPVPDSAITRDPAELAVHQESVRLAFVAALQHLPPKQRAVLILREVLRWQASEVAELLNTSVASVNSALQRARATIEELGLQDTEASGTVDSADDQRLLEDYVKAFEAYDMSALVGLLKQDAAFSMPPWPLWLQGPDEIVAYMHGTGAKCENSKLLVTRANGGPAFGLYNPAEDGGYAGWAVVVMETSDGRGSGLHHFIYPELFAEFGLPTRLDAQGLPEAGQLQESA